MKDEWNEAVLIYAQVLKDYADTSVHRRSRSTFASRPEAGDCRGGADEALRRRMSRADASDVGRLITTEDLIHDDSRPSFEPVASRSNCRRLVDELALPYVAAGQTSGLAADGAANDTSAGQTGLAEAGPLADGGADSHQESAERHPRRRPADDSHRHLLVHLARVRVRADDQPPPRPGDPRPFVRRFLEQLAQRQLDRDEALELCEENRSPVAEVFAAAVRKWGRPAVEVEQAIIDAGERVTNGLRRYLRLFNGVATISPLLGLLGTVVGMIRAFNAIATADAMGRPELLADGISQALLTTAAGLTVAIPALIVYLFFVSRVDRLIIDIDALGQQLVDLISAEALAERADTEVQTPGQGSVTERVGHRRRRSNLQLLLANPAGTAMPLKTHLDEQPTLNLTPMIDIVFLLIIFFMVGTKFTELERKIALQVPEVSDVEGAQPGAGEADHQRLSRRPRHAGPPIRHARAADRRNWPPPAANTSTWACWSAATPTGPSRTWRPCSAPAARRASRKWESPCGWPEETDNG